MRISDWSSDVCSSDLVFSRFRKHGFRKKVGLALVFQILLEMYIHFAGFHYNRIGELSLVPGIIKGENIISHQASRLPFADQVRHPFKTKTGCSRLLFFIGERTVDRSQHMVPYLLGILDLMDIRIRVFPLPFPGPGSVVFYYVSLPRSEERRVGKEC